MSKNEQGSIWRRWEPHIHVPGTVLNDQYGGLERLDEFLRRVEDLAPSVQALGVTDYYVLDSYERILQAKASGALPNVGLIFPNIELRLAVGTSSGSGINAHLLFSPEDPEHVERIKRFLATLTFYYAPETYRCERSDLIRLGRAYDQIATSEQPALSAGANQFKVSWNELRDAIKSNEWLRGNALLAISAGGKDGTAGLADPAASFGALRVDIERHADIIFSASPKQIEFWLGRGPASIDDLNGKWGGIKPCLHGSDAHAHERIGAPDLDRFCWIKGDLRFESLRQACYEPATRVSIGPRPPRGALPAQTIAELRVDGATWLEKQRVPLNPGLIAVIGARGSGKTALADLVAAGAFSLSPHLNDRSFIKRAHDHLDGSSAVLTWESGEETLNALQFAHAEDLLDSPRVQYLSQQFVDRLCSSEGVNDELMAEIERVIFQAHSDVERMGATNFRELLAMRTELTHAARERAQQALRQANEDLIQERARKASKPSLLKQQQDHINAIEKDKKDRQSLIGKGQEERTKRLAVISGAVDEARRRIEKAQRRAQQLLGLKEEVDDIRDRRFATWLSGLMEDREDTGLSPPEWDQFRFRFSGDVEAILTKALEHAQRDIKAIAGPAVGEPAPAAGQPPAQTPLIPKNVDLSKQTLSLLEKEQARLQSLVGIDALNAKKLKLLSDRIAKQERDLEKVRKELERVAKADTRIEEFLDARKRAYEAIIESVVAEESALQTLYAPLRDSLAAQTDTLQKLTFSVRRSVDIEAWAQAGEELLDLRIGGPFKGKGTLLAEATRTLLEPWTTGSPSSISAAMAEFRAQHERALTEHAPVSKSDKDAYREWAGRVSEWLYSTAHIRLSYSVQYDRVDIGQLSPGTRGIVLLLLYLAVDNEDVRPLIIDQPEENLDPQSIHDELVHRFREAKSRRQIMIVTHNANLVVNADADQVIVAKAGPHPPGGLPQISYTCGSLENGEIRNHVCNILEGGEKAFRERAKRLRVVLG